MQTTTNLGLPVWDSQENPTVQAWGDSINKNSADSAFWKIDNYIGSTLRVGANKKYSTIQDAVNAASDGDTIQVDKGTYAGFTIPSTKSYINVRGSGKPIFNHGDRSLKGGTIITSGITMFDSIGATISDLGIDVTSNINANAIDTGTGVELLRPLYQTIDNVITNGVISYSPPSGHGIRVQGGSHIKISNFTSYGFSHGIAVRASWVDIDNCYIEDSTYSGIIIKAIELTGDAKYINISNVKCVGNHVAGVQYVSTNLTLEANDSLTEIAFVNVNNLIGVGGDLPSIYGTDKGHDGALKHINISNAISINNFSGLGAFYITGGKYVSFSNCQVIRTSGATSPAAFVSVNGQYNSASNISTYPTSLGVTGFGAGIINGELVT